MWSVPILNDYNKTLGEVHFTYDFSMMGYFCPNWTQSASGCGVSLELEVVDLIIFSHVESDDVLLFYPLNLGPEVYKTKMGD
jgi:hypothetical protein